MPRPRAPAPAPPLGLARLAEGERHGEHDPRATARTAALRRAPPRPAPPRPAPPRHPGLCRCLATRLSSPLPSIRLDASGPPGLSLAGGAVAWAGPTHAEVSAPSLSWRLGPEGAGSFFRAVDEADPDAISAWVSRVAMPQPMLSDLARRCITLSPARSCLLAGGDVASDLRWARSLAEAASVERAPAPGGKWNYSHEEIPPAGGGVLVRGTDDGARAILALPGGGDAPLALLRVVAPGGRGWTAALPVVVGQRVWLPPGLVEGTEGVAVARWSQQPTMSRGLFSRLFRAPEARLTVWMFTSTGRPVSRAACSLPGSLGAGEVRAAIFRGGRVWVQMDQAELELAPGEGATRGAPVEPALAAGCRAPVAASLVSPYRDRLAGAAAPLLAAPERYPPPVRVVPRSTSARAPKAEATGDVAGADAGGIEVSRASFFACGGTFRGGHATASRATVRASDGAVLTLTRCHILGHGVEAARHATVFLLDCTVEPAALVADRTSHIVPLSGTGRLPRG
jgi:hypothetical protein